MSHRRPKITLENVSAAVTSRMVRRFLCFSQNVLGLARSCLCGEYCLGLPRCGPDRGAQSVSGARVRAADSGVGTNLLYIRWHLSASLAAYFIVQRTVRESFTKRNGRARAARNRHEYHPAGYFSSRTQCAAEYLGFHDLPYGPGCQLGGSSLCSPLSHGHSPPALSGPVG